MSKAVQGVALLGGAVLTGAVGFALAATGVGFAALPFLVHLMEVEAFAGVSMLAGAAADALTSNRGTNITTRQPASFRQIIYGEQRVGGVLVYASTTGGTHNQYNRIIVLSGHIIDSIVNLYIDGRQVFWNVGSVGNHTRNGVNFGGSAAGGTHVGPGGQHYDFGGLIYCEACYGDQTNQPNTTPNGGYNTGMHANDPTWAPTSKGLPYLGGCAYVYLKIVYNPGMFPSEPEIKFTIRGKNDILDPRTGLRGYTNNWALICADVITDTAFGLGDNTVNQAQLIAAANVCDEAVNLASGGTEKRYTTNCHYDTSTDPGNAISMMMPGAAGRISRIGGEWYLWPAYWQGPSFDFGAGDLAEGFEWAPYRAKTELFNRVEGTYIAPNYPYNANRADGSNLYDTNGFDAFGNIENNFGLAFQPTSFPQYAEDTRHGYPADQYLIEDGGQILPQQVNFSTVCSVTQAQRVAKIMLKRNRLQGTCTFVMFPAAYQMQPLDVFHMTFAEQGWNQKVFEVNKIGFGTSDDNGVQKLVVQVGVNETAASVYAWSTAEEETIYNVPALGSGTSWIVAPPQNMTLTSSAATAVIGKDGIVHPRVLIGWDEPLDGATTSIQVQYLPGTPAVANTVRSSLESASGWLQPGAVGNLYGGSGGAHGTFTFTGGNPCTFTSAGASPYDNGYFYNPIGVYNTMTHFTYHVEMMFPTAGDKSACQAFECEFQQNISSYVANGAFQADFARGIYTTFDFANKVWVPTGLTIGSNDFVAGQYTIIEYDCVRDPVANTITHTRISINGVNHAVNITRPMVYLADHDYVNVAIQLDSNGVSPTPPAYQVKAQNITLTMNPGNTATGWISAPDVDVKNTTAYISDVIAGNPYSFRIRSSRPNGATSQWVELDGYTVSLTLSTLGQTAVGIGSLVGQVTGTTAEIDVLGFTARIGNASVPVLPFGYIIPGLNQGQLYFVYYDDPNFVGGAVIPVATQLRSDFEGVFGRFLIDSIVTPVGTSSSGGGGGGGTTTGLRFTPDSYTDVGTRTTTTPDAAFDSDTTTLATVSSTFTAATQMSNIGECVWLHFQSWVLTAAATLHVKALAFTNNSQVAMTIDVIIAGVTTNLLNTTATVPMTDYTLTVPSGTNVNSISIDVKVDSTSVSSTTDLRSRISVSEIYIQ